MCALYLMGIQVYLVEAAGRERSHPILPPLGFGEPEGRAVCVLTAIFIYFWRSFSLPSLSLPLLSLLRSASCIPAWTPRFIDHIRESGRPGELGPLPRCAACLLGLRCAIVKAFAAECPGCVRRPPGAAPKGHGGPTVCALADQGAMAALRGRGAEKRWIDA